MKWTIATIRSRMPHHEKAKKRNDPIVKSHYSMQVAYASLREHSPRPTAGIQEGNVEKSLAFPTLKWSRQWGNHVHKPICDLLRHCRSGRRRCHCAQIIHHGLR